MEVTDTLLELNNILLIGMTNRKDSKWPSSFFDSEIPLLIANLCRSVIDDALLRPGRLEVHVEISLPDEVGRQQIFKASHFQTYLQPRRGLFVSGEDSWITSYNTL